MENWEKALDKFLSEWRGREEVIGALVGGSYAVGNATKFSDIDVHIVLSDKVDWRERGNKIIDGFLIEYFANPLWKLRKYREEDHVQSKRTDARIFTTGRILFDKTGAVKQLVQEAQEFMKKPFKRKDAVWKEIGKYALWEQLDNLKDLNEQKSPSFELMYFRNLSIIQETYAQYLNVEVRGAAKLYKILTDEQFRERYNIEKFPDDQFIKQWKKCLEKTTLENIEELTNYVLKKMGGFEIDGWKLRTPTK